MITIFKFDHIIVKKIIYLLHSSTYYIIILKSKIKQVSTIKIKKITITTIFKKTFEQNGNGNDS